MDVGFRLTSYVKVNVPGTTESFYIPECLKENLPSLEFLKAKKMPLPSQVAGINSDLFLTVQKINEIYIFAIEEYKKAFEDACLKDTELANNWRDATNGLKAVSWEATRFMQLAPDIAIIKQIISPILSFVGTISGMVNTDEINVQIKDQEASLHRSNWLRDVQLKEKIRIEKAIELIKDQTNLLIEDNKKLSTDFIDTKYVNEMKQLQALTTILSPDTMNISSSKELEKK